MNQHVEQALCDLKGLGFKGRDVYLAELILITEMAWADGNIQPNERALLEAFCETLTERLNRDAGAPFFSLRHAFLILDRLSARRLTPDDRLRALRAVRLLSGTSTKGEAMRQELLQWATAVAAVDGSPVWDTRELFWLETMKRHLGVQ
jgi:hypothetical protein